MCIESLSSLIETDLLDVVVSKSSGGLFSPSGISGIMKTSLYDEPRRQELSPYYLKTKTGGCFLLQKTTFVPLPKNNERETVFQPLIIITSLAKR
jgi:hypothetical protein